MNLNFPLFSFMQLCRKMVLVSGPETSPKASSALKLLRIIAVIRIPRILEFQNSILKNGEIGFFQHFF